LLNLTPLLKKKLKPLPKEFSLK